MRGGVYLKVIAVDPVAVTLSLPGVTVQQVRTVSVGPLSMPLALPSVSIAVGERAFTVDPVAFNISLNPVTVQGGAGPTFTPEFIVTYPRRRGR